MTNQHEAGVGPESAASQQFPLNAEKRRAVKDQIERVLADPLFRHSKRCTDFLRYTVSRALDETTEGIKERTLGIELFGKQPDYDTNVDPVVRVTAAEVRKRLAHYYQVAGREYEIHVQFPRGSYVPEFVVPEKIQRAHEQAQPLITIPPVVHSRTRIWKRTLLVTALVLPYLVLLVFLLGAARQNALDRFWSPVTNAKQSVLFCIPDMRSFTGNSPSPNMNATQQQMFNLPDVIKRRNVVFGDAEALSITTRVLGEKAVNFRVSRSDDATLQDLQQGPVVLIGGGSNYWSKQLASGRFGFTRDGDNVYISDKQNPSSKQWMRPRPTPDNAGPIDYAVISRILNPMTGTYLITMAGVADTGTVAAADCAADNACLEAAAKMAPGEWKRGNLQIVIATDVINGVSGKPSVLAAYSW